MHVAIITMSISTVLVESLFKISRSSLWMINWHCKTGDILNCQKSFQDVICLLKTPFEAWYLLSRYLKNTFFHCTQNRFPFNSDTVFNNIQYRTGNILLVSTGLLDDFLMTINIDTKLSSYPASRAMEAAAKPACSLFLQIRICTRVALLSPSFSVSVLLNFICKTDVLAWQIQSHQLQQHKVGRKHA